MAPLADMRPPRANFARDVVAAAPPGTRALVVLERDGSRREWAHDDVDRAAGHLAGALLRRGVRRGDVVLTLIGNRVEWVLAMVACFRLGAVVLPCTEQLRAHDLRHRLDVAEPRAVLLDPRNRPALDEALALGGRAPGLVLELPDPELTERGAPAPYAELDAEDPCLLTFTSGTSGRPKAVLHAQRYLEGQRLQASTWLGARPGELVWCTAATGWSKSARNAFIAPWLQGAAALLHDARFDAHERMRVAREEEVDVLCTAPTELRLLLARGALERLPRLRRLVAAGEPLDATSLEAVRAATGLAVADGYGQTETGQVTGTAEGEEVRPGSMGRPLPGVRAWIDEGELVLDPASVPTMCLGYYDRGTVIPPRAPWRTGDRVTADADGYLTSHGRVDDVISSAGYRIGPGEVEEVLRTHPAVADCAVIAAPDPERGSVVRAVVVPAAGHEPSPALAAELREHVRARTAPYKQPRIVDFAAELPRTTTGKLRRAALRGG